MGAKHIGKCLQTVRKKNNLTQRQMAKMLDISIYHYVLIENGEIYPNILEVLMKACTKFNLNLNYFMTYSEAKSYSHKELPIQEEDELIIIMSMYLKKLDLQSLKILYGIIMLLDNTNSKNSTI